MSTPLEDDEESIARRLRTVHEEAARAAAFYRVDVAELEERLHAKLPLSIAHLEASHFRYLCRISAGNAAIELIRKRKRSAEAAGIAAEQMRVRDSFEIRSEKARRARLNINRIPRRVRSAIDGINWGKNADGKNGTRKNTGVKKADREKPGGYTVLLMHLRLLFARRIADCAGDLTSENSLSAGPFVASAFVAKCVVWTESDLKLKFTCGACDMSATWAHTIPKIDHPPHWLNAKAFVEHLEPIAPRLTYVAWRQATSRAMKKLCETDAELYHCLTASKNDDK